MTKRWPLIAAIDGAIVTVGSIEMVGNIIVGIQLETSTELTDRSIGIATTYRIREKQNGNQEAEEGGC